MYLKSQTIRKPDGKTYTYFRLVESYREQGTVKHRVVGELGRLTPDEARRLAHRFARVAGIDLPASDDELELSGTMYFGPPLLVEQLMDQVHLNRWVKQAIGHRKISFDVVGALKVMMCAHLFKSGSRAELAVWDWQQKLFGHPHRTEDLDYQHLLRSLNILVSIKDQVEEKLFFHLAGLFDLNVDLVFYDLTSTYVEGQGHWSELLKRGYSRDKRGDCKQIVIGLVVTREGFPVTFRVFEGNRLDQKTLKQMIGELKHRFQIKRCIWVSDAGLLTEENLKVLKGSGYPFILGMGGEVRKDAKNAIEKTKKLEQKEFKDAKFWDVVVAHTTKKNEGEKGTDKGAPGEETELRRIVVVESEGRQKKTAAIFERRLAKVRQGFEALEKKVKQGKCVQKHDIQVQAEKILHQCRVKKYFNYQADDKVLVWQEHTTAVEARKSNAGKYALMTNTDLPADQVLSAYRTLLAAEDAFLVLKDILDLRPVWHKCDENVQGHVLLAVWSYLLYKTLETQMEQKEIDSSAPRALNAIKELKAVEVAIRDKAVWKLLKVPPEAKQAFEAVGIHDVKAHFKKWAANAPGYHYRPRLGPDHGCDP